MQDHFGFPINVHPFSAVGTSEKLEIAEVLNQMVRKACVFERPKTVPTTTTTATTTAATTATAHRKVKSMPKNEASVEVIEKKVDQVLAQTVATETAYSSLVSINK